MVQSHVTRGVLQNTANSSQHYVMKYQTELSLSTSKNKVPFVMQVSSPLHLLIHEVHSFK